MPARLAPLSSADGPVARFALELRALRNNAPAGRPTSVDELVRKFGQDVSRASIFAALRGKTLPSRRTVAAIVTMWAPDKEHAVPYWVSRRAECEAELSRARVSRHLPQPNATENNKIPAQDASSFGAALRQARREQGMSLEQLAGRVHFSKGYLSKIENGLATPTRFLLKAVDTTLDMNGKLLEIAGEF